MADDKRPVITLVGLKQAKKGFLFLNEGPLKECESCDLFKICIAKLEGRRVYMVTEVRDKIFPCKIHEEGVQVVEAIEPNIEANIEKRLAFPLGIITFRSQECKEALCPCYAKCVPQGLKIGDKCRIVEVREKVACPLNRNLILAVLQRATD